MPDRVLYAGIDEAGYGPRLGPLCVGLALFEVRGEASLDLWHRLRSAVCPDHAGAKRGRIAVADSKRLKGAGGARVDPLHHLERGVIAFEALAAEATPVASEASLFDRLGVRVPASAAWYEGDAALPRGSSSDQMRILVNQLAAACDENSVKPRLVRCAAVDELTFNERYDHLRNKASISFGVVGGMLRRLWETMRSGDDALAVVDRQGGRAYYADLLAAAIGSAVETIDETDVLSRYRFSGADGRRMTVEFRVEAEEAHLPVALASMAAKLVRELLMARFNRYWSGRVRGLKPTAGYGTDAGRWLRDVRAGVEPSIIEPLVRRA